MGDHPGPNLVYAGAGSDLSCRYLVEIAGQAHVEVSDVSVDLLTRLVPQWLAHGIPAVQQAVS